MLACNLMCPPDLRLVLSAIDRTVPAKITANGIPEWTLIGSGIPDVLLFHVLKSRWRFIVPPFSLSHFALIYYRYGLHPGVWLHYLNTPALRADYAPGCHEVTAW